MKVKKLKRSIVEFSNVSFVLQKNWGKIAYNLPSVSMSSAMNVWGHISMLKSVKVSWKKEHLKSCFFSTFILDFYMHFLFVLVDPFYFSFYIHFLSGLIYPYSIWIFFISDPFGFYYPIYNFIFDRGPISEFFE